jgi:hypothetical protein
MGFMYWKDEGVDNGKWKMESGKLRVGGMK